VEGFSQLSNGLCAVMLEDKIGFVDLSGKFIVPCEIDNVDKVNVNVLKFEKNSKIAYYNILTRNYIWKEEGY
jgi:hypothetical protein